jgi:hypothetical protein
MSSKLSRLGFDVLNGETSQKWRGAAHNSQVNIHHNQAPTILPEHSIMKDQSISLKSIQGHQNQININNFGHSSTSHMLPDSSHLEKVIQAKDEGIIVKDELILLQKETIEQLQAEVLRLKSMLKLTPT